MNASEIKAIVRRLYCDGWGSGDLAAVDEVFAARHVLHWNDLKPVDQPRTAEEVKRIVKNYRAAFPDLKVQVQELVVEDDQAAVLVTFTGTHTGEYEGFPPTYQKSRFTDLQILRFCDGKVVESFLASGGLRYFFELLKGTLFNE